MVDNVTDSGVDLAANGETELAVLDAHAHVIVPELLGGEEWQPTLSWEDGRHVIRFRGRTIRSASHEWSDVATIIAGQADAGIDHTLVCPWIELLFADGDAADALRRCRTGNDGLATMVAGNPERLSALGAVPMQDPSLAADELRALMAQGALSGVEVPASVGGTYLGDDSLAPFWDAAEETGALVFIHPTTRALEIDALSGYYLWNAVGNPIETTITAAQLILSGTMQRHPELRVLLTHGGGALAALRGRLDHAWSLGGPASERLTNPPSESMRRFFYDSVTHDPALLKSLVDSVGADRVVMGTDYPFEMADSRPLETIRATGLPEADRQAISGGNIARVLAQRLPLG